MVDWQIKTMADRSEQSGTPFNPGDRVACLVYMDDDAGELRRADLLEAEAGNCSLPGELLGRWVRLVVEPDAEAKNAPATLASAEDFFFSLYEGASEEETPPEEKQALRHLLALMLERKRVLRAVGSRQIEGGQPYLHVKSKRTFDVPIIPISASLMERIEDSIGEFML